METYELIKNLLTKPKEEIEFTLVSLLLKGKIDFTTISTSYIHYLNIIKEDRANQLTEANACILESFMYNIDDDDTEEGKNSIQRRLYFLNKSRNFNMTTLNEKYNYDEKKGKELSWYERNKSYKE